MNRPGHRLTRLGSNSDTGMFLRLIIIRDGRHAGLGLGNQGDGNSSTNGKQNRRKAQC